MAKRQLPAAHTRPCPHASPSAALAPVATHVCAPVAQLVRPTRQRLSTGAQAWFATQPTQPPSPVHTWFEPQVVPGALFVTESTQDEAPVAHAMTPARQAFGFPLQLAPASQASQLPAAVQTCPTPHAVPAATRTAVSTHVSAPLAHEVVPTLQGEGFVGHDAPAEHATHSPAVSHTWLAPHDVPGGRTAGVSTQAEAPVAQLVVP
jgi:hypothetical protein